MTSGPASARLPGYVWHYSGQRMPNVRNIVQTYRHHAITLRRPLTGHAAAEYVIVICNSILTKGHVPSPNGAH